MNGHNPLADMPVKQFEQLRAAFDSDKTMAEFIGISQSTVSQYRRLHGLLVRRTVSANGEANLLGKHYRPGRPMTEEQIAACYKGRTYEGSPRAMLADRGGEMPVQPEGVPALRCAIVLVQPQEASPEDCVQDRVLDVLERAASGGHRMPILRLLMHEAGCSEFYVKKALQCLLHDGIIEIWGKRVGHGRHGITICATGKKTA